MNTKLFPQVKIDHCHKHRKMFKYLLNDENLFSRILLEGNQDRNNCFVSNINLCRNCSQGQGSYSNFDFPLNSKTFIFADITNYLAHKSSAYETWDSNFFYMLNVIVKKILIKLRFVMERHNMKVYVP